jgi:hypothetical protein
MNKLIGILFGPSAVGRRELARSTEAHIPVFRRERLISVWVRDPETGRLVCMWRRPTTADKRSADDAAEPPPSLQRAA